MAKQKRRNLESISKMIFQRDIVLLSFPFSDLKQSKVRPVIVLSNDKHNDISEDIIVIPLTSNITKMVHDILITNNHLERGNLITDSRAKVDMIFSVHKKLVKMNIGKINKQTHFKIKRILLDLLK